MVSRVHRKQVNKVPGRDGSRAQWSERQKIEAVTTYLLVGKWPLVSEATGIPMITLRHWKMQDWWQDMENEIRRSSNLETGGKLKNIINKAASVVEDRLEHGDMAFNPKTNQFYRKPIGAKIASEIMVKSIDRNLLLEKLQEKPQLKEEAIMDRLKNIENALIRASKQRTIPNEIIDVSPIIKSLPSNTFDLPSGSSNSVSSSNLPVYESDECTSTPIGSNDNM